MRDAAAMNSRMMKDARLEELAREMSRLETRPSWFRHTHPRGWAAAAFGRAPMRGQGPGKEGMKGDSTSGTSDVAKASSEERQASSELGHSGPGPFSLRPSDLFAARGFEASETDQDYVYSFQNPSGLAADHQDAKVKVSVVGERTLRVERKTESTSPDGGYSSQQSVQSFTLPTNSVPENVNAEMVDGNLVVTVPKNTVAEDANEDASAPEEREIPIRMEPKDADAGSA
uniref:SHSP domain-containing protein n=1 Tax=Lotharella globosa TaxID=91324 RepID=A0A7S3Z8M0_9EUKA